MPAHIFEYDRLPEYAHLTAANQWYAWVADVKTFIAAEYGFGGVVIADPRPPSSGVYIYPESWDDETRAVILCAFDVWSRKGRTDKEPSLLASPYGYAWLEDACENLAKAIDHDADHQERDYAAEFASFHPEYAERQERDRQEQAMAAGRLF